jgi:hypothetical protein
VKLESDQDPRRPTGEVVEVVSEGIIAMVGEAEKEEVEVATENEVVEGKPVGEQIGTDVESNNLAGSSSTPRLFSSPSLESAT